MSSRVSSIAAVPKACLPVPDTWMLAYSLQTMGALCPHTHAVASRQWRALLGLLPSTSCESASCHPVQDHSLWHRQKHYFRLERQCRAAPTKKGCCRAVNILADPEHSMQGVPVSASKMDSDGSLEVWVADGMTPRRRPIVWHVQPSWSAGRTSCRPGVGFTLPIILGDSHSANRAARNQCTTEILLTFGACGYCR